MPSLEFHLRRLTATDAYLRQAENRIAHMRVRTQREKEFGVDVSFLESALQDMADSLQLFLLHRGMIEERIEAIKSGRSPA